MRHSPDAALLEFSPTHLRVLAYDLGMDPKTAIGVRLGADEDTELQFLATFVCTVFDELDDADESINNWVMTIADHRLRGVFDPPSIAHPSTTLIIGRNVIRGEVK